MPALLTDPFRLSPVLTPRPWGGRRLASLGKTLPGTEPIGESWELSDHPGGRTQIATGPLAGMLFGDALRSYPRELLGREKAPRQYPLLIKYIDAAEDLSLQVHPDDQWCEDNEHGDRGKSECWYIMDAAPDASVLLGSADGMTPASLRAAIAAGDPLSAIHRVPVTAGTFLRVPAGTVHAILGGTLLCEIQQSSDTTFRLWDWNREPARELHLEKGLSVTRPIPAPPPLSLGSPKLATVVEERSLWRNEYFQVLSFTIPTGGSAILRLPMGTRTGWIVNPVSGEGTWCGNALRPGDTWFVPALHLAPIPITADAGGLRLLLTESLEV